ncbi:hydrogenase formation protein HypD [Campylobacter sp. RM12327]|uniref:hydrogenase formation protein HypD n=1 Tax=Campylobacter sputorum TaxID=206 RepID=UPI000B7825FD|nr:MULTISPECIES: hydrogenase formation protein HypD [Campylobacter]ASM39769.1 hydrogenase expression/formation protein HypD [Campylobacter sputorum]MBE7358029.1 hydrogenase formation protein HypD [Campylobacter sp. RM11302]MBF6668841.1 hydrogenase formation protein HypD [Campylobacter sp. RM12327]MBF6673755.1 hydrogenase formation protein HypD [Campylobacter sp. RM13538]MBF6676230.1 hydrogenase formation protein HypD [Campylobacter sp. RM12321]
MDLISEFRDKELILALSELIKKHSKNQLNIMEICGGHTHSLMKFGLNDLVGENINFIHGPGCPVCVMPKRSIDEAIKLASMPDTIFCTLADMLRVPGSNTSLQKLRAKGHDIRSLYTPLDVIKIALENKDKIVIFFAIGFETTTPMSAVVIQKTIELDLKNLFFHINHVTVPAPIRAIMNDENVHIDAFLGPSHVSVITGSKIYESLANEYKTPIAVSGFEPLDMMDSILNLVIQHENGTYEVYNQYKRVVKEDGNLKAKELINKYFEICDFNWRGLGIIKSSGYDLKSDFDKINAKKVFDCSVESKGESKACMCGEILRGRAKPYDCKVFAKACNPQNPIGSCMVSSEGACAAYYKYQKRS